MNNIRKEDITAGRLNTRQVCEAAGITTRQLNNWVDHKWVLPDNYYDVTIGQAFTWSAKEVEKVCLMARLTKDPCILPHKAAAIADHAMAFPGQPVCLGEGLFLLIKDKT